MFFQPLSNKSENNINNIILLFIEFQKIKERYNQRINANQLIAINEKVYTIHGQSNYYHNMEVIRYVNYNNRKYTRKKL